MAEDVFGRTPFGSIIATVLCCLGVGLFLRNASSVEWLESLQILLIILAVIAGCLAIMFLVFGILATGATRQNVYSGAKCIMGGRISALFFLILTFVSNVVWVCTSSVVAMPVIIFAMLWSVCENEIEGKEEWYLESFCLNLSRFGIYRNYTEGVDKNAICDPTDLDAFCKHVKDAEPMYILAFCGSLLIVLGFVVFLLTLTVNYHKIITSKELTEYRTAVDIELEDSFVVQNRSAGLSRSAFSGGGTTLQGTTSGYSKY